MKKFKFIFSLFTFLLIFGVVCLGGCSSAAQLSTPIITLENNVAKWSTEEGIEKFEISLDGLLSYYENSVAQKVLEDGQTLKVRAIGDGKNKLTSAWSNSVTYEAPVETYNVTWKNGDTIIKVDEKVLAGTMPNYVGEEPEKEDENGKLYSFKGWYPSLSVVTGDITYTAQFSDSIEQFIVMFNDFDGTILDIQVVNYSDSAIEPTSPSRTGYTFCGWDTTFDKVKSNLTITAIYLKQYQVTFVDYDGTILSTQIIDSNNAAKAPQSPTRNGFDFIGWDKSFDNVTQDLQVKAVYEVKGYKVTFLNYSDDVVCEQIVEYGCSASTPSPLEEYINWQNMKAYRFLKWNQSYNIILQDTVIRAVYEEITVPIFIVKGETIQKGADKASIVIYLMNNPGLLGMSISISFDEKLKPISIVAGGDFGRVDSDHFISVSQLGYNFVWSGNCISEEDTVVLRLTFKTDDILTSGTYCVSLSYESNSIMDDQLNILTPQIIQGYIVIV